MSYTAVPTVVAGNIYTPTMYNTYLQNNADSGFMRMLADTTLGIAAASIDFTSIPATFAHLMLVILGRESGASASDSLLMTLNGDVTAGNYLHQLMAAANASQVDQQNLSRTNIDIGQIPGTSVAANYPGATVLFLPHYAGTTFFKTILSLSGNNDTTAANNVIAARVGAWKSAVAVNRVTITPSTGNLVAGSRATLYGLPA